MNPKYVQELLCARFLRPIDGPTYPESWGDAAPYPFRRHWGPIGATWPPEIDECRSEVLGSIGPNKKTTYTLFWVHEGSLAGFVGVRF